MSVMQAFSDVEKSLEALEKEVKKNTELVNDLSNGLITDKFKKCNFCKGNTYKIGEFPVEANDDGSPIFELSGLCRSHLHDYVEQEGMYEPERP